MRLWKTIVCISVVLLLLTQNALALPNMVVDSTYNYSSDGNPVKTLAAYEAVDVIAADAIGMEGNVQIQDLFIQEPYVYLLSKEQETVYVLNADYTLHSVLSDLELSKPEGFFVTEDSEIYVADTGNHRIVVCSQEGQIIREYTDPGVTVSNEVVEYSPSKLAVDKTGRIYVVAKNINRGLVELNADGSWNGFIGAPKVKYDLSVFLYKMFATDEQRRRMASFVPTEFNNVAVDEDGFVYATIGTMSADEVKTIVATRDKSGTNTPIKKLNAAGDDILLRNGFYAPVGDLVFDAQKGCSTIVDVAVRPNGLYTLADNKYGRLFTYDSDGNLLYILGGSGEQRGFFNNLCAVDYNGEEIVAVDTNGSITVFAPTEYGRCIEQATEYTYNGQYDLADACWDQALEMDANIYSAYVGKGNAEYRRGNYQEAMAYFKVINDEENYSKAKEAFREHFLEQNYVWLGSVALGISVLVFVYIRFIRKKREGKSTRYRDSMKYAGYILFHPFDGFYDLKHERRGTMAAALSIYGLVGITTALRVLCSEYLFNTEISKGVNVFTTVALTLAPYLLWCISNWCLTSLMDGEGGLGDIIMATGYALTPLIFSNILYVLLSWVLVQQEGNFIQLVEIIGLLWACCWVFFATMIIQQYSLGKSIGTAVLTIVGMALIVFILLLLFYLMQQIYSFVAELYLELLFLLNS